MSTTAFCSPDPALKASVLDAQRSIVPRHGVTLLPLDDGSGLLLDRSRRRVIALNASAATIWCLLAEPVDASSLTTELADATALDTELCKSFVDSALSAWADLGLLDDGSPVEPLAPSVWPDQRQRPLDIAWSTERQYALLGLTCAVRFADVTDARRVDRALAHLAVPVGHAEASLEVVRREGRIELYLDGRFVAECESVDHLTASLVALLSHKALLADEPFLNVHAAAIGGPKGCVLLPAASGSGKTTLTAALIHRGHHLLSDEVAPLCAATLTVRPFPLPLAIKEHGREVVATLFPAVMTLPLDHREGLQPVAFLPPPDRTVPAKDAAYALNAVIFPRFQPAAVCEWRPLGIGETLSRLFGQCAGLPPSFGPSDLRRLVDALSGLPCVELTFGSLDDAMPVIERLGGLVAD